MFCEIKVLKTFPRETYWSYMFGRWHTVKPSIWHVIVPISTLKPLRNAAGSSFLNLWTKPWINSYWCPTKPEVHEINFGKGWLLNKWTNKCNNHASSLTADIETILTIKYMQSYWKRTVGLIVFWNVFNQFPKDSSM